MRITIFELLIDTINTVRNNLWKFINLSTLFLISYFLMKYLLNADLFIGDLVSDKQCLTGIKYLLCFCVTATLKTITLSYFESIYLNQEVLIIDNIITRRFSKLLPIFIAELAMFFMTIFTIIFSIFFLPFKYMFTIIAASIVFFVGSITSGSTNAENLFTVYLGIKAVMLVFGLAISTRYLLSPYAVMDDTAGPVKACKWSWHNSKKWMPQLFAGNLIILGSSSALAMAIFLRLNRLLNSDYSWLRDALSGIVLCFAYCLVLLYRFYIYQKVRSRLTQNY